jgi:hypothetical protein
VKRWLFTILLFLLLGAIVNVAVAWGIANWVCPRHRIERHYGDGTVTVVQVPDDIEHGWPLRTLTCEADTGGNWVTVTTVEIGELHLPFWPIFPGFLVNTLFYGVILWLLYCTPLVLRRHIRLKRGRCPKCGYDLRGAIPGAAGGCPECGWGRDMADAVAS